MLYPSPKQLSALTLVLMDKGLAVPQEQRRKQREQAVKRNVA